jgi:hypothetical protein
MNKLDRTSKTLLFFLVVGVWGLLLRPFFLPTVVQAQTSPIPQRTKQTALVAVGEYRNVSRLLRQKVERRFM